MIKKYIRRVLSYIAVLKLKLLSRAPLFILYKLTDVLYVFLYYILRYRRKVVLTNLTNAFPYKNTDEIKLHGKEFYRFFSDLLAEFLKLESISFADLKRRCTYTPESTAILNRYYEEGRSIMIVMGHLGNWEWAGASYPLWQKHNVITAYRPLKNAFMDKLVHRVRTRTGNSIISMQSVPREVYRKKDQVVAVALISDQTPPPEHGIWLRFLNQETIFFKGAELIAKKYNMSVFWASVKKAKRGYYNIDIKLIANDPNSVEFSQEGDLTKLHAAYLERDILASPANWLWSHRRWKHKPRISKPIL